MWGKSRSKRSLFFKKRESFALSALLCLLVPLLLLGVAREGAPPLTMRLDVLGLARALGAVAPAAGSIDDAEGRSNADDDAAFASAWLQCGAVLALHPSR